MHDSSVYLPVQCVLGSSLFASLNPATCFNACVQFDDVGGVEMALQAGDIHVQNRPLRISRALKKPKHQAKRSGCRPLGSAMAAPATLPWL